jgi:hypothetical protein
MKKFFAGVFVAGSIAGSMGFATSANAGTTTTTNPVTATCGVNNGGTSYNDCAAKVGLAVGCGTDLGMSVASMTPYFGAKVQLSGYLDETNLDDPNIYTTTCGVSGTGVSLTWGYSPAGTVTLAKFLKDELFKVTKATTTVGSLKPPCNGTCAIVYKSIGGFGTGAELRYDEVAAHWVGGKGNDPVIATKSLELIAPVGNKVLFIDQSSHAWTSLQSFLSFAHVVYQAAMANA